MVNYTLIKMDDLAKRLSIPESFAMVLDAYWLSKYSGEAETILLLNECDLVRFDVRREIPKLLFHSRRMEDYYKNSMRELTSNTTPVSDVYYAITKIRKEGVEYSNRGLMCVFCIDENGDVKMFDGVFVGDNGHTIIPEGINIQSALCLAFN